MKRILFCLFCFLSLSLSAQELQRSLILTANDTVVERLTLPPGESGMEMPLTLKFYFDETANTVTVIAESTGNIFGLQAGARYRNIFQRGHIFRKGGKFMVEKLTYDVKMDPTNTYRMGRETRKSLGSGDVRKNYYFHRWIESDGMDMRNAKTDILGRQMIQVFSLAAGQEKAKIALRDIFTVEHKGATPKKWNKLMLTLHHDINVTYDVELQHNPCFGKDDEINATKTMLQQLQDGLNKLSSDFPAKNGLAPAVYEMFMNRRDSLIALFPQKTQKSDCADLQEINDQYNKLVNDIIKQRRELNVPAPATGQVIGSILGAKRLDANALQFKARQLDELVGQWMINSDANERQNIRLQCQKIISDAAKLADGRVVDTDEQRRAVKTFRNALDYYRRTVR